MSTLKEKRCTGCKRMFTFTGYDSHLKQTKKAACIRVRDASGTSDNRPDTSRASPPSSSASSDDPIPNIPDPLDEPDRAIPFDGDYFGDYSNHDFDNFDEYEGGEHGSFDEEEDRHQEAMEDEDTDDLDAQNFEAEGAWEAPPQTPSPAGSAPDAPDDPAANDSGEEQDAPDRSTQIRAQEHLRAKTFKVSFPGGRAGTPVDRRRERSAYENYQAHIDSVNSNPYAPFVSKMDWGFARWAKARGPGSTAVSELLQMENVSTIQLVDCLKKVVYSLLMIM